jgi:hypothetical protein
MPRALTAFSVLCFTAVLHEALDFVKTLINARARRDEWSASRLQITSSNVTFARLGLLLLDTIAGYVISLDYAGVGTPACASSFLYLIARAIGGWSARTGRFMVALGSLDQAAGLIAKYSRFAAIFYVITRSGR